MFSCGESGRDVARANPGCRLVVCTDTGIFFDASIVSCDFEILQRFDSKVVMETPRKFFPYARHRRKNGNRLAFAAETIEHRKPAVNKDVAN